MIYFISDTHFNHSNIIQYCNRPFKNTDDMNKFMIQKWNETISDNDIVYHLGDVCFGNKTKCKNILNQLKGKKYLIKGNHDRFSNSFYKECGFIEIHNYLILDGFLLIHYPLEINGYMKEDLKKFICKVKMLNFNFTLHGHIHNKECNIPNHFNVSVENINYTPISFNEIKKKFYKTNLF